MFLFNVYNVFIWNVFYIHASMLLAVCVWYTVQLSAESSVDDDDDETSSLDSRHRRPSELRPGSTRSQRSRIETLRRLEEAVVSGSSDIEWDCAELGVTYDQLASYFDNLKESTA